MLSEQIGCFGQRVRRYEHPGNPGKQFEQTLVIFRGKSLQPTMLEDQISIYTAHHEQHEKIRVNEEPGRGLRLIPKPSGRDP